MKIDIFPLSLPLSTSSLFHDIGLRDFFEMAAALIRTACVIRPLTLPFKECFPIF